MGTYYELRCLDCDDCGGIHADRRRYVVDGILPVVQPLMAFARAVHEKVASLHYWEYMEHGLDFEWLSKHVGHNVVGSDGYGRAFDQCSFYFEDGSDCMLPCGHEGEHSVEGPFKPKKEKTT